MGWSDSFQPFDLLRRLVEDGGDLVQALLVHVLAGGAVPERGEQIADRALDRRAAGLALVAAEVLEPLEQAVDLVRLLGEMRLALAVIAKALRAPSPFTSSIRPMSWSMVSVG